MKDAQMRYRVNNLDSITKEDTIPLPTIQKKGSVRTPVIREQETMLLPAIQPPFPISLLPRFLQDIAVTIFTRMKEPDPERWSHTLLQKAVKLQTRVLGWFPLLTLTCALGIFLAAHASVSSIHTSTDQEIYLWLGLLLIFAPSFLRLLSPMASRLERIGILCSAGLSIYLVPEILSPLHFIFVDEYMHWRTVDDIVRTGHLFSENSMLPVSPLYPGLEIVTDALSSLSGLNTFTSGLIVVGIARIAVLLYLFVLFEQIAKSTRIAGIAAMLYMSNSGFFMFDSLFLYEALGLAFGSFVLFVLSRAEEAGKGRWGLLLTACMAIGALTATHHVSDFFFIGLLIFWTFVHRFLTSACTSIQCS